MDIDKHNFAVAAPLSKSQKSRGMLDDLFGIKEESPLKPPANNTPFSTTHSADDDDDLGFDPKKPKGASKTSLLDDFEVSAYQPAISRQSTDTENSNWPLTARPKTSTGGRRSSTAPNTEAFGFFGEQTKERESNVSSSVVSTPKKARNRGSTADWLGINLAPDERKDKERTDTYMEPTTHKAEAKPNNQTENASAPAAAQTTSDVPRSALQMPTANALQQQHLMQLSVVGQMEQQEKALSELLQQHEQQFHIIQQQIQQQQQAEDYIIAQISQRRMNAHVRLMMTQPTLLAAANLPSMDAVGKIGNAEITPTPATANEPKDADSGDSAETLAELQKLQLEKTHLEQVVESSQAYYDKERNMIEESYRKQLKLLEEHNSLVEATLKAELDSMSKHYAHKLSDLQAENDKLKVIYGNEIANLKRTHDEELSKAKQSREDDLAVLREEQRRFLENVRQAKLDECAAVQDGTYLESLRAATSTVTSLAGDLQALRNELETRLREKETLLATRELKLETERQAFATEVAKAQGARERDFIAERQEMQALQARVNGEIQEERKRLLLERAEIEAKQKINSHCDYDQLALETSLKVAQEATDKAHKGQRQNEQQRRELVDKENVLRIKEDELDKELCSFRLAERKAQATQERLKRSADDLELKAQILQKRMCDIAEKEASLSRERMLIAKERIKLNNVKEKLRERKCEFCKMAAGHNETSGTHLVTGNDGLFQYQQSPDRNNAVERLLDDNLTESYRKMQLTSSLVDFWTESVLDDDSKELALHKLNPDLQNHLNIT